MKGILFKPEMITAIVNGVKTQTRRLSGLREINKEPDKWSVVPAIMGDGFDFYVTTNLSAVLRTKPRYQAGEVVYIKEAWGLHFAWDNTKPSDIPPSQLQKARYKLDEQRDITYILLWRTSLFMPAWAARYFIRITDVRPQRLQEITCEDVIAEGCGDIGIVPINTAMLLTNTNTIEDCHKELAKAQYQSLWDSINPKFPFSSNPRVWAYTFEVVSHE